MSEYFLENSRLNTYEEIDLLIHVSDTEAENTYKDIFTPSFKGEHRANWTVRRMLMRFSHSEAIQ